MNESSASSDPAVEFISATHVQACRERIHQVRERTSARVGPAPSRFDAHYWQTWFETNAEELLKAFPSVQINAGYCVRYCYFGPQGADLRVRPFVTRTGTPLETVQRLLAWHPPPDSMGTLERGTPNQDVQFLYSHFSFPRTAQGYFDYWLVMQELWASARWAYSHVLASHEELSQLISGPDWQLVHPVERYQPALVRHEAAALLAVLVHCPLNRFEVTLQRIEIDAAQALHYHEPILVAAGPRGYVL